MDTAVSPAASTAASSDAAPGLQVPSEAPGYPRGPEPKRALTNRAGGAGKAPDDLSGEPRRWRVSPALRLGRAPIRPAPVGQRCWPSTSPGAEEAAGKEITETTGARPVCSLQPSVCGRWRALRPCTGCRGHRGFAGSDEGGAQAGLGRRTESPPPPLARRVNKAATRASHLPGTVAPRPLSPGGPDRVGRGQRDRTQERRQQRRQGDAGQGPRCFLRRSPFRRSGSVLGGCVTSGPGSTSGRWGLGGR